MKLKPVSRWNRSKILFSYD